MNGARRALPLVALTLVSCTGQVLPASTPTSSAVVLSINATTATLPLISDLTQAYAQVAPDISFEIVLGNYATAAAQALSGEKIYFLTNHLPEQSGLWGAPVGQDAIIMISYPGNPVGNLTIDDLRGIFQGRIVNWQAVGGIDLPIIVMSRETGSGTRAEFDRLLMGDRQTTRTARIAPSNSAVIASVIEQPGSIGYVSLSYVTLDVRPLRIDGIAPTLANVRQNLYPLRSTLFFAGPGEPDGPLRAFIAWVQSPDGQRVVAQRYTPLLDQP
jgi:phosphate transport system substrate-binding protein